MLKPTLWAGVSLPFTASIAFAQEGSIDKMISDAIAPIINPFVSFIFSPLPGSEAIFGTGFPWIVMWLVVAALVFTLYFGFIQFRGFRHSIELGSGPIKWLCKSAEV